MSTREYAKTIIDRLTDEQVDELFGYMEDRFLPEPPNAVHSIADIEELLTEADDDIKNSRLLTSDEVKKHLWEKYGI